MRTTTSAQDAALAALDRTTHIRVKVEDPDGVMVDIGDLYDQDWVDQVVIEADLDNPISAATVVLFRKIGEYSLAPLDEDSVINRDSSNAYAPFLNPNRDITIEVATMLPDEIPAATDWEEIWDGIIDEVDWGGSKSRIVLRARDPMARLNDTFIDTVASYGSDALTKDVEDVMQDILTAEISSPAMTLEVPAATNFAVLAYELGNVSVLDALFALRDLIGWNLTWKWKEASSARLLTLWEPSRSNTTADHTFGPDDYYIIPRVSLAMDGIRNVGECVYKTTAGTIGTATDTRTDSVTLYSERFIRIDARETSVVTATQASDLISNVLDDLEEPNVQQQIECAFFWPIELGDLYAFSANDHYSTEQKYGVFGYRHVLSNNGQKRTVITASGKPSGGYRRWHMGASEPPPRGIRQKRKSKPPAVEVSFNENGQAVVSASGNEDTRTLYVKVGDGSEPADPTISSNDGTITGRSGTVDTGVAITTGNDAYVRVIAVDYDGQTSAVATARHNRRMGPFHKDTTTRSHSQGAANEETLETITVPADVLGSNGGIRMRVAFALTGSNAMTVRIKFGGSTLASFFLVANGTVVGDILFFNNNATNAQVSATQWNSSVSSDGYEANADRGSSSIDTTSSANITITGELANTADQIDLTMSFAEYIGTN